MYTHLYVPIPYAGITRIRFAGSFLLHGKLSGSCTPPPGYFNYIGRSVFCQFRGAIKIRMGMDIVTN